MPLGGKPAPAKVVAPKTLASTKITEGPSRRQSQTIAERRRPGEAAPIEFAPGDEIGSLTLGRTVTSSINFQTVSSHVEVTVPTRMGAEELEATKKWAQAWVDTTLIEEAGWATETLQALGEIKRQAEG